ncbi:terminase large subunit [Paenibacillus albicereus]|uniref:Terminase large subunit n=1 Tax=Paenibacillus albicereus TaxID=2726185 RepID=A0A6H2GZD1_9BACL|nr:terminase TerL endonuclease subunit [Paenibacillus albicereus]QJC52794.1 terminase large subunit [Paenibacillus albicereus]
MAQENATCPVLEYAQKVLSGEIIAGELVKLACQRHLDNLRDSQLNVTTFEYYFDDLAAAHAIDFYRYLKHSKGKWARQSFQLELWQKFIVGSLFGWLERDTQLRRFRVAYDEIARKNGKSTLAAGVGNYLTIADGEYGAEVYSAATKLDQAKLTFDEASRMVKASPDLLQHVRVYRKNMSVAETGAKFEPLGADSNSLDGLNVHGAVIDEYHAHKSSALYDVIESGTSAREQPLIFVITTAGFNIQGPCHQLREYAVKVLKGIQSDETFFAYIAAIDEDDDPFDESCWPKANPNLGVSKGMDYMRRQANKAKQLASAYVNFLIKDLNRWVNAVVKWMPLQRWDAAAGVIDKERLLGRKCIGGLDLSTKTDISAFALLFPPEEESGVYEVLLFFWMPEETDFKEREERDGVPYRKWIKDGLIMTTPGNIIDYRFIKKTVLDLAKLYDVQEIAFDPWNATQIALELADEGLEMVELSQNLRNLSAATKELEALVIAKRFFHGGNEVLRWMADNVVIRMDANENIAPDKKKSSNRIDGIAAIIDALARALVFREKRKSAYEKRGLRKL